MIPFISRLRLGDAKSTSSNATENPHWRFRRRIRKLAARTPSGQATQFPVSRGHDERSAAIPHSAPFHVRGKDRLVLFRDDHFEIFAGDHQRAVPRDVELADEAE